VLTMGLRLSPDQRRKFNCLFAGRGFGEGHPKEPVATAQPRPGHRPPVHGELLAQGEVPESELAMATAEERAESKQVEQRADYGGQCLRIRAERSTACPPDGVLAKDRERAFKIPIPYSSDSSRGCSGVASLAMASRPDGIHRRLGYPSQYLA